MKRASEATKGGTADEIAALRAADQRVRDTFGELTVLDDGVVPGKKAEREAALAKVETPEQRFAALKMEAEPPGKRAKAGAAKRSATKAARGPRPLARDASMCALDDGRVLVLTGEDFGQGRGEAVTRGATFVFDPATTSFSAHEPVPAEPVLHGAGPLVALAGGRAMAVTHRRIWQDGRWGDPVAAPPELAEATPGCPRLRDGSHLAFGAGTSAFRVVDGRFERIGDLPERRTWDTVIALPDGRYWLGAGEAQGTPYFTTTERTVVLDPRTWTFSAGPDLPTKHTWRWFFYGLPDGRVLLGDTSYHLWSRDGGGWLDHGAVDALKGSSETFQLRDGSIVVPRWRDGVLVRVDPVTLEATPVGELYLGQTNPHLVELTDGRLLFTGGTLFNNSEAEPEVFDLRTGQSAALPGWEKERERQRKALLQHREKRLKRGY